MSQISKDKYYAGWMYINRDEYDFLKKSGVFGPMIFEEFTPEDQSIPLIKGSKQGTVGQCYCSGEVLLKLEIHYRDWWKDNYIHYDNNNNTDYPINQFSEISLEWLARRRSSEWEIDRAEGEICL